MNDGYKFFEESFEFLQMVKFNRKNIKGYDITKTLWNSDICNLLKRCIDYDSEERCLKIINLFPEIALYVSTTSKENFLFNAVLKNKKEVVKRLLELGAAPTIFNHYKETAVYLSSKLEDKEIFDLFIEKGYKLETPDEIIKSRKAMSGAYSEYFD